MNTKQASLENSSVSDFFDHFKMMSIKGGDTCDSASAPTECKPYNSAEMIGSSASESPPPVILISSSHLNSRIPSLPLAPMQLLAEDHLLPVIVPHHEPYEHSMHRSVVVSNVKGADGSSPETNILIYEKTAAAPDTPPVSNSPSPPIDYYSQHPHQFPHVQPVRAETQNCSTVQYDPIMWINDPIRFHYEKPLDLRGSYMEEACPAIQNWDVMQQHTSVITDGSGKRMLQDYSVHHRRQQLIHQQSLALKSSVVKKSQASALTQSTTSSNRSSTEARFSSSTNSNNEDTLENESLMKMSVRALNNIVKGLPKERQEELKKLRRTLKNRIYAHNCRKKRDLHKDSLQTENYMLQNEKSNLMSRLHQLRFDKQILEGKLEDVFSKVRCVNVVNNNNTSRNIVHTCNYTSI